jgi:hypothetical protein
MRVRLSCVYCGKQATTKDHVIPRCLLEKPFPPNLPTVPSCRTCNEGYSEDEAYFLAVLAQTGFVASLRQKMDEGGSVDRMLERSPGLDALFAQSMAVSEDGRVVIQPDESRIGRITRKVAFGLYCHRYTPRTIPPIDEFLALKPMHNLDNMNFIVMMAHNERFRPRRWTHFQTHGGVGKERVNVFDYMFVKNWVYTDFGRLFCIMRFHETVWAAVRCPNPPGRRSPKRRVGSIHTAQLDLPFADLPGQGVPPDGTG